jgi:cytochrome P450
MTATTAPLRAVPPAHVPEALVYDFDYIRDEGILADPHGRMAQIATTLPPLFWTPHHGGHWVVNNRKLLAEAATDVTRFSSKSASIPPIPGDPKLIPLTFDPPVHTAYRIPLNPHFSPKGVARLEATVRSMTDALIDAVIDKGRCEFLHEVAEPLPVVLFMQMAGMPTDRVKEFRHLAETATASPDPAARGAAIGAIGAILAETVTARIAEPRDDLISHIVAADVGGRKLEFHEIVNYAVLLFLGGLETVVNAISFDVRYLALHPDVQDELRADPASLPRAIEELLRLHGIPVTARRVAVDTRLGDVDLRQEDLVMMLLPAINFDPAAYTDAGSFCPMRKEAHVSFNMGPHRCLGANLARLELRVFFEQWLARVPRFRLDPAKPPRFFGGLNLAVRSLDIEWT